LSPHRDGLRMQTAPSRRHHPHAATCRGAHRHRWRPRNSMQIHLQQLVASIHAAAAEIRPLKAALRQAWSQPMGDVQRTLHRLKRRATELCVLRAHLRGRLHILEPPPGSPPDWDAAKHASCIAARVALEYAVPERVTEASA
jgi:hypothetical protein